MNKILILAGGPVRKLDNFVEANKKVGADLTVASFSDINYQSHAGKYLLSVGSSDISSFDIIYFRVVGRRIEDATLVANYAKDHNIKIVDKLYADSLLLPSSISKATETAKLIKASVPIPKTVYGSLNFLREAAPKTFGYPFVVKSTTGKKAREVWAPQNEEEFGELFSELRVLERGGARYFAQEFLRASKRYRVFVMDGKVFAALVQPTKWRKRFIEKLNGEFPEGVKGLVENISPEMRGIAIKAAEATDLDITGVDIMEVDDSGELLVIEANAAPSWNLVEKYTGKNMAEEILKYLISNV